MKPSRWIALSLILLLAGLIGGIYLGIRVTSYRDLSRFDGREVSRTTDPSGRFDALVLFESLGGATGSIHWYVCIVPQGRPWNAASKAVIMLVNSNEVKLSWQRAHLLTIHHSEGTIEDFTNLWGDYMLKTKLPDAEPYWIEIQLAASSPLLRPDGNFN